VQSKDIAIIAAEVYKVLKLKNKAHSNIIINARKNYNNKMLAKGCLRKANRIEIHTLSSDTLLARARLKISYARQVYKALSTRNSYLLLRRASCGPRYSTKR
jgi:hypothetical protein